MNEAQQLYPLLLHASEKAFEGRLYNAAYHVLSGALYCAVSLKDGDKVREVEQLAREQYETLRVLTCEASKEPMELSLYTSLLQIARTRLILISK